MAPKKATATKGPSKQDKPEVVAVTEAPAQPSDPQDTVPPSIVAVLNSALFLSLLAIITNISQHALSPVYGSVPPTIWHGKLLMAGAFIGWSSNTMLKKIIPVSLELLLPTIAGYIPFIQSVMYRFSEKLGAEYGPVVTEALTIFPMVILTAAYVANQFEAVSLSGLPEIVSESLPGVGSWIFLYFAKVISALTLNEFIGGTIIWTRMCLEVFVTVVYAIFAPSALVLLAIPGLIHTFTLNQHVLLPAATEALNKTMMAEGWMLLDRKESNTGYISVIQNVEQGYRLMRCDHSLLGGEWMPNYELATPEPVFGVFPMLEAVRLVKRDPTIENPDTSALVM